MENFTKREGLLHVSCVYECPPTVSRPIYHLKSQILHLAQFLIDLCLVETRLGRYGFLFGPGQLGPLWSIVGVGRVPRGHGKRECYRLAPPRRERRRNG